MATNPWPTFGPYAYTLAAVVEAGVPPEVARTLLADDPAQRRERPRLSVTGRKRGAPTLEYVWGPDANCLLEDRRR